MSHMYQFPGPPNTTSGTSNTFTITTTTYKRNPFRGLNRVIFAVDEWGHRHLGRLHGPLMGWLCDWWDRRLGAR